MYFLNIQRHRGSKSIYCKGEQRNKTVTFCYSSDFGSADFEFHVKGDWVAEGYFPENWDCGEEKNKNSVGLILK